MKTIPYVITNDINLVVDQFYRQQLIPPSQSFTEMIGKRIEKSLKAIFGQVDMIKAQEISDYLENAAKSSSLPVISISSLVPANIVSGQLEFSRSLRLLNQSNRHAFENIGIQPRHARNLSLKQQFNSIAQNIPETEITLLDDVVFTGGTILKVAEELHKRGIHVKKVIASVLIEDAQRLLSSKGIEASADRIYTEVIDEVCARDFMVGLPDGGRNIIMPDGAHATAPYIFPFGNIGQWASIPEPYQAAFSKEMLQLSSLFWDEMNEKNLKDFTLSDLTKKIVYWPDTDNILDGITTLISGRTYERCFADTLRL